MSIFSLMSDLIRYKLYTLIVNALMNISLDKIIQETLYGNTFNDYLKVSNKILIDFSKGNDKSLCNLSDPIMYILKLYSLTNKLESMLVLFNLRNRTIK